ncbi:nuclease-related domain-containing protein [Baekduia sp.]|uniref:nuclease-related domain-containing protein n=1 Tax=Baekduia sp. TaxID=2600305 RepID=UPI002D1FA482|nr:nuclease-related domain-containing protein [Baekduia sp.]
MDRGVPGASALREHARRKHNREQTRQAHPHIGGLLLALRDEPQHEQAFLRGARGEAAVAGSLEARTSDGPTVLLHDRRMPRGRGNIDHLAISPNGIFVIDAKDWKGKVSVSTPLLGKPKLLADGRDRTKRVDGLDRQVAAVESALGDAAQSWPIQGVFCFTKADLPMLGLGTTKIRSHLLLYRKALAKRLNASGPFTTAQIDAMARVLAGAFPPA